MDDLLDALGDGTRRRILDVLCTRDGRTLTELRLEVGASRQVVAHHVGVLEAVGLVSTRREGRHRLTFIDTGPLLTITRRWSVPETPAPPAGLRTALDLLELGAQLRAQRHRREHPDATEAEVQAAVDAWLIDRRQAPHGDAAGRHVPWPRNG